MKIIGLTGHAGAGKDYTFDKLADFYAGDEVVRYALADQVRIEAAEAILDAVGGDWLSDAGFLGTWKKPYSDSQRRLLQWWGTDYRRSEDPDYWVRKLTDSLEAADHSLAVVTDIRFANEADAIRRLGGIVVEVEAADDIRASRLGGHLPPAHASEVIDFDTDGTITSNERTVLSLSVAIYLDMPGSCVKCRTLYREHPWHDGGQINGGYTDA